MYIAYTGLSFQLGVMAVNLEPLYQLNAMVARRFGGDGHWTLATAILATHENLVKKKLVELGLSEGKIEGISREKGFPALVGILAKEIQRKENRRVSLAFYKASALRMVRNKMEHEGYNLTVKREEVLDLLKEIRKFEAEMFPSARTLKP
jgi:hypothetical protein